MIRYLTLVCILIYVTQAELKGQVWLDTIEIKGIKPFYGLTIQPDKQYDDSIYAHITQFLRDINGSQVQISTPGGLTTLLHRGFGNRHLPVLWQGLNIQNTLNGSYDLSLIPGFLFDNINFYSTGNPSLSGTNGLAGALTINNNTFRHTQSEIYIKSSSLQNYDAGLMYAGSKNKWHYKAGIQSGYHSNRFKYLYNLKKYNRHSTDLLQNNIVVNTGYRVRENQTLQADIWWQYADRIIPVSITSSASTKQHQKDNNYRSALSYKYYTQHSVWNASAVYSREYLHFEAPAVDSKAKTNVYFFNAGWTNINRPLYINFQHRMDVSNSNFYTQRQERNTSSVSILKPIAWSDAFQTDISFRQDITDKIFMPFSWTLSAQFKSLQWIFARNYSLPGLNDLYWPTGGNPDLKTEKAFKSEIKYTWDFKFLEVKSAIYANLVDNWIQWIPFRNDLWTPVNQKKVCSRGMELSAKTAFNITKSRIILQADYAFNRTTAIEHYYDPKLKNKQLIYVPVHKTQFSALFKKSIFDLGLEYQFTGIRYDAPDETGKLTAVHMLNFKSSLWLDSHSWQLQIFNLLQQDYYWVRFYPMPGLNAELTYKYHF